MYLLQRLCNDILNIVCRYLHKDVLIDVHQELKRFIDQDGGSFDLNRTDGRRVDLCTASTNRGSFYICDRTYGTNGWYAPNRGTNLTVIRHYKYRNKQQKFTMYESDYCRLPKNY